MRIGIAADHGGFELKESLVAHLREAGHEVVNVGATASTRETTIPALSLHSRSWSLPEARNAAWQCAAAAPARRVRDQKSVHSQG